MTVVAVQKRHPEEITWRSDSKSITICRFERFPKPEDLMGFIWTSFVGDVHGAEYCHGMKEQTEVQCKMLINPPLTPCIALIVRLLHTYPQQDDPLANNRVLAPANVDHHAQIIATRYIIEHPPTPAEFSRLQAYPEL